MTAGIQSAVLKGIRVWLHIIDQRSCESRVFVVNGIFPAKKHALSQIEMKHIWRLKYTNAFGHVFTPTLELGRCKKGLVQPYKHKKQGWLQLIKWLN